MVAERRRRSEEENAARAIQIAENERRREEERKRREAEMGNIPTVKTDADPAPESEDEGSDEE